LAGFEIGGAVGEEDVAEFEGEGISFQEGTQYGFVAGSDVLKSG